MVIRKVKDEIRILGVDDAPHQPEDDEVLLVGTVYRGGVYLDGVLSEWIQKDGDDVTEKIVHMFKKTSHRDQLRIIMLDGITFGGFNVADVQKIHKQTDKPVIVVIRDKPGFKGIKKALDNVGDSRNKWELHVRAGEVKSMKIRKGRIYFQHVGISESKARQVITKSCTHSFYPEPVRIAHIIGAGIILGRSKRGK